MKINIKLTAIILACVLASSCGTTNSDALYYGRTAAQGYIQGSQGGTYVGTAGSASEAEQMAKQAGYSKYQYYPNTGACYGY